MQRRKLVYLLFSVPLLLIVFSVSLVVRISYELPDISSLDRLGQRPLVRVFSRDKVLIGEFGERKSIPVGIDKMPVKLMQAIVDTEDRRFFEHSGIDIHGLARACFAFVTTGKKSQGASTITMQLARNFFFDREKTFMRKISEIILAIKINNRFSKKDVLNLYMNEVYFGEGAYGVVSASQTYYGKTLDELTVPEIAMLAGLPQAPSRNNPVANKQHAIDRRNHVLARMLAQNHISELEYKKYIRVNDIASMHTRYQVLRSNDIVEMAKKVLADKFGDDVYKKGYDVYTTIDSNLQKYANIAMDNGMTDYGKRHNDTSNKIQGALVAISPNDGSILALVGSSGNEYGFNRAIQSNRLIGSTVKPFIYSAALNKGFSMDTVINDEPLSLVGAEGKSEWNPQNYTMKYYGPTPMKIGLVESRNVLSVRLLQMVGLGYVRDYMRLFGFSSNQLPDNLTLALGTATASPLQLASYYCVFANSGKTVSPYFIEYINDSSGSTVYSSNVKEQSNGKQVIDKQNTDIITGTLKHIITKNKASASITKIDSNVAGKTGTTNSQIDGWFCGYNDQIVTVVWVGFDANKSTKEYGVQAALPIWSEFMKNTLRDSKYISKIDINTIDLDDAKIDISDDDLFSDEKISEELDKKLDSTLFTEKSSNDTDDQIEENST